jgi:phosphoglycolate phosphatase
MPKRFELVVFDWDGTVMDSTGTIVYAIQQAAIDIGLDAPSHERASHIIGLGLIDALRHALPDLPHERYRELAERYKFHYLSRDHEISLFDGIERLLDRLETAGHQLAVATGKSRAGLDRVLDASGLRRRFGSTRCADECHSKPHPQMLEELMSELGVSAERVVMIGDTTHDLQMAINAGVAAIGVSYGAHPRDQLEALNPLLCADTVTELDDWLIVNG